MNRPPLGKSECSIYQVGSQATEKTAGNGDLIQNGPAIRVERKQVSNRIRRVQIDPVEGQPLRATIEPSGNGNALSCVLATVVLNSWIWPFEPQTAGHCHRHRVHPEN